MTTCIDDIEFKVEYNYTPEVNGVHTTRGGDPGWPDEPEQVDDIVLTALFNECELSGQAFSPDYDKLPEHVQYRIYNEICEYEKNKAANKYAEAHERRDD